MAAPATTPPRGTPRLLSLLTLLVLIAAALAAFALSRLVLDDQEDQLLVERTAEVEALLGNSLDSIEASLRVLGPVGASSDPAAVSLFQQSATPLVEGRTASVGVAVDDGAGFKVVAAVGGGPAVGEVLTGERAALAARAVALAEPGLVSALATDETGITLVLARHVAGGRAVAYRESAVNPTQPVPSTPESSFRGLRVALYASPEPDPDALVVTTETDLPLSGRVETVPFTMGSERWTLTVAAREPLVGSFARTTPWLFLAGGLVTAVLATVMVETLARRRAYALALVADRTAELEAALAHLRATNAFVDRLMTALPVVVTRVSVPDGRLTYASPSVARVLGVSPAEAMTEGFIETHVHPEDLPAVQAGLARIAEGAEDALEYRFRRDDGTEIFLSTVGVPETDDAGRVTGIFGYAWDVTDRRRAEEAQRRAQATAEEANQAKSQFLSRMSHELRTPLNAVLGFGQLLEIDELTDAQRDAVSHILRGGRHLLDLINEVLDISRVEAGELALSPESVLVSDLVDEAAGLIRPLADQRGIQLVVDRSGSCDCYMFADRQRIKQVLLNLLSNAVKYNRARGSVALSCEQLGTRVRIAVADTGAGIAAERLGLLFTPFERLGAEHTGEEGTGIGLALSRRLAEAMGGTLDATSTLGKGSTFTVELPQVEGPIERHERLNGTNERPEPADDRRVVLHIEDNLSNLTLIERVLAQRADVEVVAAMQGRLGLELAREHRPVLVLLDLHLPDLDGDEVLQRLREDAATAAVPVVMLSADATPRQVQRLLSAGATDYLTKPVDVRELLRVVDDALTR